MAGLNAGCTRIDVGPGVKLRATTPAGAPVTHGNAQRTPAPAAAKPASRTFVLGRSVRGMPLVLEVFGQGPDTVLIHGGIHGNEPSSAGLAHLLAGHLRHNPVLLAGRRVAVLAEANPDGLADGRRTNARGVDLNRNFPARNWRPAGRQAARHGPAAASEPETRALVEAIERLRPRRIIALHSIARGRHCVNYDGPAADLAAAMSAANGYPVKPRMGYPTPGSFGSWAGIDRGLPTITLELPRDLDTAQCWHENAAALLTFIRGDTAAK